jgi:hypothetical protein
MDGWDIISAEEIEDLQRMVKETGVKNIPDYISRKTKQWKMFILTLQLLERHMSVNLLLLTSCVV